MSESLEFIKLNNVSFAYDDADHAALKNVNLTINKGEFVCVLGKNGSGKSTMARLINGLLLPTEGNVTVCGMDTADDDKIRDIRALVGMVFQNPDNQIIGTSVVEDVAFGPENLGMPHDRMVKSVYDAIDAVGLKDFENTEPHLLSGGQKQRVAIAGILAMHSKCIVLDEATAMLDPKGRRDIMSILEKLNRDEKITVIHITHHMSEAVHADKIVLINNGEMLKTGTPEEIFADEESIIACGLELPKAAKLMQDANKAGLKLPKNLLTIEKVCEFLDNRLVKSRTSKSEKTETAEAIGSDTGVENTNGDNITMSHVTQVYMPKTPFEQKALDDVNLTINKGEFIAVIGHTGSGKSTLAQHLNGLLLADKGTVCVNGEAYTKKNASKLRKKVGYVFQYPEHQLFEETVYKDIAFGLKNSGLSEEEQKEKILKACKMVGLSEELLDKSVFEISGGQKRRAAICGVVVMEPDFLVLDEPASGLDPEGKNSMLDFAKRINGNGSAVILISHNMDDVASVAKRVVVMNKGNAVMSGTPSEVFADAGKLVSMGLEIPEITRIFRYLAESHDFVNSDIMTVEEGVAELVRLSKEGRLLL